MGEIACIGWGSLIWDPRTLPVVGKWHQDGPDLPIEFARLSSEHRLTLVLCNGAQSVRTLWAPLRVSSLAAAVSALGVREGIKERNWPQRVGRWPNPPNQRAYEHLEAIEEWANAKQLEGVVWTALGPNRGPKKDRPPSIGVALRYLKRLERKGQSERAKEYICCAPASIRTSFRDEFERELGWKPSHGFEQPVIPAKAGIPLPLDSPEQEQ
jgi:hypothetical protein